METLQILRGAFRRYGLGLVGASTVSGSTVETAAVDSETSRSGCFGCRVLVFRVFWVSGLGFAV